LGVGGWGCGWFGVGVFAGFLACGVTVVWSGSRLRLTGFVLMFAGLLVASLAFVEDSEGVVVVFPFVYGVDGLAGIVLSFLFMGVFLAASLLPWLMLSRRGLSRQSVEVESVRDEAVDYLITVDVPEGLGRTIFVDGGGSGSVVLRSTADSGFRRVYSLPGGFSVEEYTYQYEANYLVLRFRLVRL